MRKELILSVLMLIPIVTLIVGVVMSVYGYEISHFFGGLGLPLPFGVTYWGKIITGFSMLALVPAGLVGQAMNQRDARARGH